MNLWHSRCAALLLISVTAFAQTSSPLQSLTTTYGLQRSTLTATAEAQVKAPRDRYLAALNAAQKAAVAATRTTDLAAISAEMEAVAKSSLPEPAPPDLPRALLPDRRALSSALAAVERMLVPKQRELAVNYQRSLAALEETARRSKDQALLDAIAAEKERAVAEVESVGGGQKNRNVIENGDFSRAADSGLPPGWTRGHSWK